MAGSCLRWLSRQHIKKMLILVLGCEHTASSGKAPARLGQPQRSQALLGAPEEGQPLSL